MTSRILGVFRSTKYKNACLTDQSMQCEMCGEDKELFIADIEGSKLKVCKKCGRYGKILSKVVEIQEIPQKAVRKEPSVEVLEYVNEEYPKIIKQAREKRGLTQEDFAKMLNERESMIQHLETGKFEPPILLAKKLERALNIKLVEEMQEVHESSVKDDTESLTIGDVIKIKKK